MFNRIPKIYSTQQRTKTLNMWKIQNTEWSTKRNTRRNKICTNTAVEKRQHQEKRCTIIIQGKYTKTTSHLKKKIAMEKEKCEELDIINANY